jgi:hypothetical protein
MDVCGSRSARSACVSPPRRIDAGADARCVWCGEFRIRHAPVHSDVLRSCGGGGTPPAQPARRRRSALRDARCAVSRVEASPGGWQRHMPSPERQTTRAATPHAPVRSAVTRVRSAVTRVRNATRPCPHCCHACPQRHTSLSALLSRLSATPHTPVRTAVTLVRNATHPCPHCCHACPQRRTPCSQCCHACPQCRCPCQQRRMPVNPCALTCRAA